MDINEEIFENVLINIFAMKYNVHNNTNFSNPIRADKLGNNCKMPDYKLSDGQVNVFVELKRLPRSYQESISKRGAVKKTCEELKREIGGGYAIWFNEWKTRKNPSVKKNRKIFINEIKKADCLKGLQLEEFGVSIKENLEHSDKIKYFYLPKHIAWGEINKPELLKQIEETSQKFQNANRIFGNGNNILLLLQPGTFADRVKISSLLRYPVCDYTPADSEKIKQYLKNINEIYSIGLSLDMKSAIAKVYPSDDWEEGFFDKGNPPLDIESYNEIYYNYFKSGIIIDEV
jgi:hypothetical protein